MLRNIPWFGNIEWKYAVLSILHIAGKQNSSTKATVPDIPYNTLILFKTRTMPKETLPRSRGSSLASGYSEAYCNPSTLDYATPGR
jgi:hypothetical protein